MIDIPDTIFQKNEDGQELCPKCNETVDACVCPSYDPTMPKLDQFSVDLKVEKVGRKGKVVTVVSGFPADEGYLKKITRTIKTRIGCGGTFYIRGDIGIIEIQGNKRDSILEILQSERIKVNL